MKSDEVYGQKYSDIDFVVQVVLPARFPYFQVFEQLRHMHQKFKMLCAIWYHFYNLKHVKNTPLCFLRSLNCTNGTKSRKASHS